MSIAIYVVKPTLQQQLRKGPLANYIDQYATRLLDEGHCRQSAWRSLRVVGDFSRWLGRKGLGLEAINEPTVDRYQQFRARYRCPFLTDRSALNRLLALLRERGVIAQKPVVVLEPIEQLTADFEHYLREERGLTHVSATALVPSCVSF